jgi:hypothetical protein
MEVCKYSTVTHDFFHPSRSPPLRLKPAFNPLSQSLTHAVTVVTGIVLLSRILLLMILPLEAIMKSKCKFTNDDEKTKEMLQNYDTR